MSDDIIDIEGFEKYGPAAYSSLAAFDADATNRNLLAPGSSALLLRGQGFNQEWLSLVSITGNPSASLITGLQGFGRALAYTGNSGNGVAATRNLPGNYARLMLGFALATKLNFAAGISFFDGSTIQCSLWVDFNGRLNVNRGDVGGGNILWTSAGVILSLSRNYIEIDITIHNSAGAFRVWLNGAELTSQSSLNTRAGSNSYANAIGVRALDTAAYDDMYWADNTGGTRAPFGDRTVYGLPVTADSAADFSPALSVIGRYAQLTANTSAPGANQLALIPVTPAENLTLNNIGVLPQASSGTVKFKGVVYADSAGVPGALLSSGTEVVGCTANTPLALPLSSAQSLTGGTQYWIGLITDTSIALQQTDAVTNLGAKKSNTYSGGAPNPAGSMTAGQGTWSFWGSCTGAADNYHNVNGVPAPILANLPLAYNESATPTDSDLYSFASLPITPDEINIVKLSVLAERSDTGARTMDIVCKSGGDIDNGDNAGITPATSMNWYSSRYTEDPATNAAWTPSGVNSMTGGPAVAT